MIDRPTSVLEQSNCSAANLRRAAAPRQLELQCNVATPPTPLQPIWLNCQGSGSTCFLEISMAHSTRSPLATNFLTKWRFQNHMRARPVFADTNKIVDNILVSYPTRRSQCTNNIQNIWAKKILFCHLEWDSDCCLSVTGAVWDLKVVLSWIAEVVFYWWKNENNILEDCFSYHFMVLSEVHLVEMRWR